LREEENVKIYFSVMAGIAISVILPLIRALLPKPPVALRGNRKWEAFRPYLATGLFSLIVALLVVAVMGNRLDSWSTALIAGYTWDSTLQKVMTGNAALNG
jgi:hypothetical protein